MSTTYILQNVRVTLTSLLALFLALGTGCQSQYKCISTGDVSRVKRVLEAEKDIGKRKECTRRLLSPASGRGHIEVVAFLLKNEIGVNELEEWATIALFGAARCGHSEVVKLLLANDADVTMRCDGRTALQITRSDKFRVVLQRHSASQNR